MVWRAFLLPVYGPTAYANFGLDAKFEQLVEWLVYPHLVNIYSALKNLFLTFVSVFCLSDAVVGSTKSNTICPGKF